jgi:hypothetical protein
MTVVQMMISLVKSLALRWPIALLAAFVSLPLWVRPLVFLLSVLHVFLFGIARIAVLTH